MNLVSNSLLRRVSLTFTVLLSLSIANNVFANNVDDTMTDQKIWTNVGEQTELKKVFAGKSATLPLSARLLELNEIDFKSILNGSSNQKSIETSAAKSINSESISLPLPDGSQVSVNITPSKVMSDALAKQYPEIKTWKVSGVSQDISGVIDFSDQGFRGMLLMPNGDRVFIQPDIENISISQYALTTQSRYISFSQKQNKDSFKSEFSCGVHDDHKSNLNFAAKTAEFSKLISARAAPDLITYRLAVAATGEYTQASGGTVSSALSSIVTTISRVNELYVRDLGIQFELIDEQSDLIYLNPNTDPYSNSDIFTLIQQNNQNLSSNGVLSKSKYDIGHVFGAGNVGGLAIVGGICIDDEKAYGATGISNPFGDAFALDYVAHEIGHQVGGSHTFNSACGDGSERTGQTAVEPGSGTTIMAYPGICQSNNIQNSVDAQFHVVSIDQIRGVTRTGTGANCGVGQASFNENPTVDAGEDTVIPARTPLVLIATGNDANNDDLTYVWEQTDTGEVSDVAVDTGNNALFRSRPLTRNNARFIPTLDDLFAGTSTLGELLPVTDRDINMAVTVRDGRGGLQADLMKLSVVDTDESFRVTSQSSNQTFFREDIVDVRWNVAGTNLSPISCSSVDIALVTVDGEGVEIATTANDGRAEIIIPDNMPAMDNARFVVSCSTSNFFNVSSGRLTIVAGIDDGSSNSGGGGSFGGFMLLLGSLLVYSRKMKCVVK